MAPALEAEHSAWNPADGRGTEYGTSRQVIPLGGFIMSTAVCPTCGTSVTQIKLREIQEQERKRQHKRPGAIRNLF